MRWWWALALVLGCSDHAEPRPQAERPASTREHELESESEVDEVESEPTPTPTPPPATGPAITVHFAWPAPATAEVHVDSEHDFGGDVHVAASYHYHLSVQRDETGYRIERSGMTLESHAGSERLRLGNVLVEDVTQHSGDLHLFADGTHITPLGGFDPIEASARSVLSEGGIDGPLADAILALGASGWEPINVVDYDDMVHEWNGRSFVLGVIQPADAIGGAEATRIMSRASAPCDEPAPTPMCVELVRTEQAEQGSDHIEHVYTLLAEPDTLRPHSFQHESRTDSETAHVHYAETLTTTFRWQ